MSEGLGGLDDSVVMEITRRAYVNRLSPAPSSHCGALYADLVCRLPRLPDAPMCGMHQSDGNPTIDASYRPGVGLTPICCKVDGYPLQGSRCLHTQYAINGGDERRKMLTFLEVCLQVHFLLHTFCLLKTIFSCIR